MIGDLPKLNRMKLIFAVILVIKISAKRSIISM